MPSRTFLTKEEKSAPGFKAAKDRFTLLFCVNASGLLRCKPMLVFRSQTPRSLKNKNKDFLPVFWKWNPTAWVTQVIFTNWFTKSFIPEVKKFLAEKNLAFKVLLLMDNARCHPEALQTLDPNVQVVFLPPNTTSLIQPMDQTVIATFKANYLRRVMRRMLRHMKQEGKEASMVVEPRAALKAYWKGCSIFDCITIIQESWEEIKISTLNACWSNCSLNWSKKPILQSK